MSLQFLPTKPTSLGTNPSCCVTDKAFSTLALQFPKFLLPFRAWESRWTLQDDLGRGHEIQAVKLKWGSTVQRRQHLYQECLQSSSPHHQVASSSPSRCSDTAQGTGTADVWYLGCYGVGFSTQAGTQLPAVQGGLSRAPGRKNPLQSILQLSAIWKGRWHVGSQQRQSRCREAHSQMPSPQFPHKEKRTWQIQPSPEPEWQNSLLQSGFS